VGTAANIKRNTIFPAVIPGKELKQWEQKVCHGMTPINSSEFENERKQNFENHY
jgi:hypothetical protein